MTQKTKVNNKLTTFNRKTFKYMMVIEETWSFHRYSSQCRGLDVTTIIYCFRLKRIKPN